MSDLTKNTEHRPYFYTVIESRCIDELTKEVCKLMKRDWETTGGISGVYHADKNTIIFYQAMIKSL